ncbi:hypothetical protein [Cytobacillus praedii]|uniref:hypothetical protein n=1 Tax=Cytobacillus praedii TaxID=1742358 RepID=UPI002E251C7E|nr:hypothetical protein [Cytobacillus praedii]
MNPSFQEQLKVWKRQHQETITRKKKLNPKTHKSKTDFISESDIKSLMGMNRPTYRRGKGGAFKQR